MKSNIANQLSVLIPEANSNFLPFIVNCLFEVKGVKIYIISNKENAELKHSRKIEKYPYYPKESNELEWISNINNELKRIEVDVIMPIDEYGIEALIKNKDKISHKEKLVFLPSLETFYQANDKGLLAKHLLKHQIATPKSFLVKSGHSLNSNLEINFPVLAKPTLGFGGGKGIIKFSYIRLMSISCNASNN